MVKIMDLSKPKVRNDFWDAFRACAEENRVRPDRSPFHVNWARSFARFLPEKPLKDRSKKDIEDFLADLEKRGSIADWQVRQAESPLKILYEIFLPQYKPEKQTSVSPVGRNLPQEKIAKADRFRDRVIPGEVERRFSQLIEVFQTEIRARHFSYRTKTSYLEWMKRFKCLPLRRTPRTLPSPDHLRQP